MTDRRFSEVVIEPSSYTTDDYKRGYKACCSACGTYHKVSVEEFELPALVSATALGYVAKMRAWNCCHEGDEPLDGLPEEPDVFGVTFK